ncbi:MAG TPA: hypothetical protein VEU29_04670 [Actinomycetota bacterium]|nr:hypothetical protein [Actinomycetota bacterium]
MFVLRLVAAIVAIAALTELTGDLVDKARAPAPEEPRAAAPETPAGEEDDDRRSRPAPQLVHEGDPTVYDAQEVLDGRCTRQRGSFGPASRGSGLDDDVATISRRVERIRWLDFRRPVDTRLVSRSEVGARFVSSYLRRYGEREAARDQQVLVALRLLPEGADLRELTAGLLGQGVAGFYSPRKDRLYAGGSGDALTPYDEMVLAHELDHALVDQALRLPGTLSRDPMLGDTMLAHQALGEGDATLVMIRYAAARFTEGELDAFLSRFTQRTVQASTDVPYFVARASEFPYYEGLLFVCSEWRPREWDAVDRMYLRPPASTADVLFPFRYHEDNEVELPRSPASPGAAWGRPRAASFGAFDLMVLLENADLASKGETIPGSHVDAVRGWDGGVLHSWLRGPRTTIHLGLVDAGVETPDGRDRRLCGVLRRWFLESFPDATLARPRIRSAEAWKTGGELAILRCKGREVELGKGPSPRAVRRLFG